MKQEVCSCFSLSVYIYQVKGTLAKEIPAVCLFCFQFLMSAFPLSHFLLFLLLIWMYFGQLQTSVLPFFPLLIKFSFRNMSQKCCSFFFFLRLYTVKSDCCCLLHISASQQTLFISLIPLHLMPLSTVLYSLSVSLHWLTLFPANGLPSRLLSLHLCVSGHMFVQLRVRW